MGKIELDGEEYFTIPPNVPVYSALNGKITGDFVRLDNMNFNILCIE